MPLGQQSVEPLNLVNNLALRRLADSTGVADVMHRRAFALKGNALKFTGQETGGPLSRRDRLSTWSLRRHHDITGQILCFSAESIQQPRPHRRSPLDDRTAVHEGVCGVVIDLFGRHASNHRDLIRNAADVGQ